MKIVHALGWYYPESLGGTEIYVAGLCRRLRAMGHDVYVAAPQAGRRGIAEYVHEGTPVLRYPIPANASREEAQGTAPVRGTELFHRWLERLRPDVLHIHSLVTGLGLHEMRIARRAGIRIVVTHHLPALNYVCRVGTLMERNEHACDGVVTLARCASCTLISRGLPSFPADAVARLPQGISAALGRIPGRVGTALGMAASIAHDVTRGRELAALVDYQVVLNDAARRIMADNHLPTERVVLNRLGTDHQRVPRKRPVREAPTRAPIRIGYLGRIDRTKGVRELAHAAVMLPRGLEYSLEIRGPVRTSSERQLFDELQRIVGRDSRVQFAPPVASADVPSLLARFDVVCCPSTWFENGPTVALEAMAVGTPLIASRIGNLAEIVEDGVTGRLVPAGDIDALAAALREVVEHPRETIDSWRAQLGPVRSMDEITADYLQLYGRMIAVPSMSSIQKVSAATWPASA